MTIETTLENIARQHLGLRTLAARNSDALDFHDHAVWSIEAALKAAFDAGKKQTPEQPDQPIEAAGQPCAAQAAYMGRQGEIEQLLSDLGEQLKNHAARAAEQPLNWGFAGDLGRVEQLLGEVVDGLSGRG